MKKILFIAVIALVLIGCNKREEKVSHYNGHTYYTTVIRYEDEKQTPKEDSLFVIRGFLGDTIIVQPATLDDCRRVLEENGQG